MKMSKTIGRVHIHAGRHNELEGNKDIHKHAGVTLIALIITIIIL